jgi:hypothetical protein
VNDTQIIDIGFQAGIDIVLHQPVEFAGGKCVKVKDTVDGDDYRIHDGLAVAD